MINMKRLMTCLSAYALCIAILPLSVSAKQGIMAQEEPAIELSWNDSAEEELPVSVGETEMIPPENENLTIEVQPSEHCQLIVRADRKEKLHSVIRCTETPRQTAKLLPQTGN